MLTTKQKKFVAVLGMIAGIVSACANATPVHDFCLNYTPVNPTQEEWDCLSKQTEDEILVNNGVYDDICPY